MTNVPGETYLVGGAVRDTLLDIPVTERDWVVVGSTPEAMIDAGFKQVGKDFPVFLHPESKEEYALARTERKTASGHTGFAVFSSPDVTLEDDLARRDLTINAIAMDNSGRIFDPYDGQKDLGRKTLRHVTESFSEDPLRILRVARFAAKLSIRGFDVATDTLSVMTKLSKTEELAALSAERVWRETEKALSTESPRTYFEVLRSCGALVKIFPEIDALFGIDQRPTYHPEIDCGLHTMLSLDQICMQTKESKLRFATLVHDLGKATTPSEHLPGHPGHEERGAKLVESLCERLRVPNEFRNLAVKVSGLHLSCHRILTASPLEIDQLIAKLDGWRTPESVEAFVECCMADARGRIGLEERLYPQKEFLLECISQAGEANVEELMQAGFSGKALGNAIAESRQRKISEIQQRYSHIDEDSYARPVINEKLH